MMHLCKFKHMYMNSLLSCNLYIVFYLLAIMHLQTNMAIIKPTVLYSCCKNVLMLQVCLHNVLLFCFGASIIVHVNVWYPQ